MINTNALMEYPHLMQLALQRARTAREAIQVMTQLVADYGYASEGESISIADTQEAWILEIVGHGPWRQRRRVGGGAGARRRDLVSRQPSPGWPRFLATIPPTALLRKRREPRGEQGWYDPKSGQPFRFCDAYCPATPFTRRVSDTRVWSILRRAAPSGNFSPDYHRSKPGAEPYPLFVKPDKKLTMADVFALLRDHYEGTEFDMTQGIDAGPFGQPRRSRPLIFKVDGVEYCWERPISTQQTAFSSVSQSRAWLPDLVGGVLWFGMDDSYTTCYSPFYCCLDSVPKSFAGGSIAHFSWDSAWWVFNLAANYAGGKSSYMMPADPGRAKGHRVEPARAAAGGREDRPRIGGQQYEPRGALPDRLFRDARRIHRGTVARLDRAFDHKI